MLDDSAVHSSRMMDHLKQKLAALMNFGLCLVERLEISVAPPKNDALINHAKLTLPIIAVSLTKLIIGLRCHLSEIYIFVPCLTHGNAKVNI